MNISRSMVQPISPGCLRKARALSCIHMRSALLLHSINTESTLHKCRSHLFLTQSLAKYRSGLPSLFTTMLLPAGGKGKIQTQTFFSEGIFRILILTSLLLYVRSSVCNRLSEQSSVISELFTGKANEAILLPWQPSSYNTGLYRAFRAVNRLFSQSNLFRA